LNRSPQASQDRPTRQELACAVLESMVAEHNPFCASNGGEQIVSAARHNSTGLWHSWVGMQNAGSRNPAVESIALLFGQREIRKSRRLRRDRAIE
jgi:hypothetical protein